MRQKEQRKNINQHAEPFCDHHRVMPFMNRQREHDQFGENQRRETDRDNVQNVVFEQKQRSVHDRRTLINTGQKPNEKRFIGQRPTLRQHLIDFRKSKTNRLVNVFVEHQRKYWIHRVDGGISNHQKAREQLHGRKIKQTRKYRLHRRDNKAPMHDELTQTRRSFVTISPVN